MPTSVNDLIDKALEKERFKALFRNRLSQFVDSRRNTVMLGALLLPLMDKMENRYEEYDIQFETIIADDSNRYDPAVKKERAKSRSLSVSMGHFSIGVHIDAQKMEKVQELLDTVGEQNAENYLLELFDKLVRLAIDQIREKHRWESIIEAKQYLVSADDRKFTLSLENPADHRIPAKGSWSDPTYNPIVDDIVPAIDFLEEKGYRVRMMVSRKKPLRLLQKNEQIMKATKSDVNQPDGGLVRNPVLLQYMRDNVQQTDLPGITTYDNFYKTQAKTNNLKYYIPDNALAIICETGRDYTVAAEEGEDLLIQDTIGYFAVGKVMNEQQPGDFIQVSRADKKPDYIEAEAFSAGASVIQDSEAILIINGIS